MIVLAQILVGGSIVRFGPSKTLAQGTNNTNATSASEEGIPVTYRLSDGSHNIKYRNVCLMYLVIGATWDNWARLNNYSL